MKFYQRCGHRLHIHVPVSQLQAAIDFAAQAAGPNAHTVTSRRSVEQGGASTSSSSQASTNTESSQRLLLVEEEYVEPIPGIKDNALSQVPASVSPKVR